MEKLIPAFEQSVFNDSFTNSIIDIAEVGIDSILEEGLLKKSSNYQYFTWNNAYNQKRI